MRGLPWGETLPPDPPGPGPPVPDRFADGWALSEWLADHAGLLVSPGELYGPDGSGHVRVAVVQPMDRLELVAQRLSTGP